MGRVRHPDFLIVGTPRSGTTLVQRLASELPGVQVPPETHFFTDFVWSLHRGRRFPLQGAELRAALEEYRNRQYFRSVPFDPAAIADDLGGRCETVIDLFAGVVAHLAGSALILGEKTPGHLLWWRPLSRTLPGLKLVCVLRDPRGVVASNIKVGWSRHPVMTAQRWNDDLRRAETAAETLGRARCLLVRYEDVLHDPAAAKQALARFLGSDRLGAMDRESSVPLLFPAWETWKATALGPMEPVRADAWRNELRAFQRRGVGAICREGMERLGYDAECDPGPARRARLTFPPAAQLRRAQHVARRWRRQTGIEWLSRDWPVVSDSTA